LSQPARPPRRWAASSYLREKEAGLAREVIAACLPREVRAAARV